MRNSSKVFDQNFSLDALRVIVDEHLQPETARGVDGSTYDQFINSVEDELKLISIRAKSGTYKFSPYRQKLISKGAGKIPRQISIPTLRDRVALRALNEFLLEAFPLARPRHSFPIVQKAIESYKNADAHAYAVKLDIQDFYGSIRHEKLIGLIRRGVKEERALSLISEAIKTPTGIPKINRAVNSLGVPQGLSVSNILSSIYLLETDRQFELNLFVKYHRYVDDILILCSKEQATSIAADIISSLKRKRSLTVHPIGSGKSNIVPAQKGFEFLGYTFLPGQISVRKATENKILTALIRIILGINQKNFVRSFWRLNLRISGCRIHGKEIGWIFYFSQIDDMRLLIRLDAQIRKRIKAVVGDEGVLKCKSFVKAFREVKYNRAASKYFFDFDKMTRDQMLETLAALAPSRLMHAISMSDEELQRFFFRIIKKEVRDMEVDTLGGFS